MKPPETKLFKIEQYPSAPDWFHRFLMELTSMTERTVNCLSANISISDNWSGSMANLTMTGVSATPTNNIAQIPVTLNKTPRRVDKAQVVQINSPNTPIVDFAFDWRYTNGLIEIIYMKFPVTGADYSVKFDITYY